MELSENARQVLGHIPYGGSHAVPLKDIAKKIGRSYITAQMAVKEIREAGYPVCASPNEPRGLYMARNAAELEEYVRMTSARVLELTKTLNAAKAALRYMKGE